jgi:cyclase
MLKVRAIPSLLLKGTSLVKTIKFDKYNYIGDPLNTLRIFNELEVDEITVLDITASIEGRKPNFELLSEMASECFMPLAYGGGISSIEDVKKIFNSGIEKVIVNTALFKNPSLVTEIATLYGSQSVIASIDVKKNLWGKYHAYVSGGKENTKTEAVEYAKKAEQLGAGEILLYSIERDGTYSGYDLDITKRISEAVGIPVIALGGAGKINDLVEVVKAGASAVSMGSMVVYQKQGMGVLVNFPMKRAELNQLFSN